MADDQAPTDETKKKKGPRNLLGKPMKGTYDERKKWHQDQFRFLMNNPGFNSSVSQMPVKKQFKKPKPKPDDPTTPPPTDDPTNPPNPNDPTQATARPKSNSWPDIIKFNFPKGAGKQYKDGGLVRGGGKATKGRGRGRFV